MESWKRRNLVHQGAKGTQDRGKGKNLELSRNGCEATAGQANSRKEVMKESSFSLLERTP